jgi:hypothetical protein
LFARVGRVAAERAVRGDEDDACDTRRGEATQLCAGDAGRERAAALEGRGAARLLFARRKGEAGGLRGEGRVRKRLSSEGEGVRAVEGRAREGAATASRDRVGLR